VDANKLLKQYVPIARLGRGGMADVYLVVTASADGVRKLLVMKQLRPSLSEDPSFFKMFMDEARLSVRLSHPNVVQVYEVQKFEEAPVILMDYLEGVSLGDLCRKAVKTGVWRPEVGLAVLIEALAGLDYAHKLNDYDGTPLSVVHRDFTPQNIFVTFDGFVKVLDFGIAKAQTTSSQTKTGQVKGTIRYMPPESMEGKPVDLRADVYSAGIILLEMVSGRRIWENMSDVRIMRSVLDGAVPSLTELIEDAPPGLVHICRKATARDPNERYASAAELRTAIREYVSLKDAAATQEEIAALSIALFGDRREQVRALVRDRMENEAKSVAVAGLTNDLELPVLASRSSSSSHVRNIETRVDRSQRKVLRAAIGGTLGLAALGGIAYLSLRPIEKTPSLRPPIEVANTQETLQASAPPQRDPEPEEKTAPEVMVTVVVQPTEARVVFDGKLVAENPAIIRHPRDESIRTVVVSAPGFETSTYRVPMVKDLDLSVSLQRIERRRAARPTPTSARVPTPPPEKPTPSLKKPESDSKTTRQIIRSVPWETP
jgi:eukaryotic-like serine/threonine-protein kinase